MRFTYEVTVDCESQEQADQVMVERLGPDEDYGFPYQLSAHATRTSARLLQAGSLRQVV